MIHYIGRTSMAKPHIFVPPQHPFAARGRARRRDLLRAVRFLGTYAGQVLRTFTVDAEPTPL
jgi:hypothetical protein